MKKERVRVRQPRNLQLWQNKREKKSKTIENYSICALHLNNKKREEGDFVAAHKLLDFIEFNCWKSVWQPLRQQELSVFIET